MAEDQLPPLLQRADTALEGGLAQFLKDARADRRSWEWIARELYAKTDRQVDVSGVTVQAWATRLDELEGAA